MINRWILFICVVLEAFKHSEQQVFSKNALQIISEIIFEKDTQEVRLMCYGTPGSSSERFENEILQIVAIHQSQPIAKFVMHNTTVHHNTTYGPAKFVMILPELPFRTDHAFHMNFSGHVTGRQYHKYVLIVNVPRLNKDDQEWLYKIFEWFWQYSILNVIAVYSVDGNLQAFSYTPFTTWERLVLINITNNWNTSGNALGKVSNMNGFRLNVTMQVSHSAIPVRNEKGETYRYSGVDGNISHLIGER